MSDYEALKKRAKEYGINTVGKSREDLEKAVKEAEDKKSHLTGTTPITHKTEKKAESLAKKEEVEKEQEPEKHDASKSNANAAVVYDGKREVRTYKKEDHGDEFVKLADSYITKHPNYTVKLITVKEGIKCPQCGHEFNPE